MCRQAIVVRLSWTRILGLAASRARAAVRVFFYLSVTLKSSAELAVI